MPIQGFICPDGTKVLKEDCLRECKIPALPGGRCKAIPFLRRAAKDKVFDGVPSTTQLLAGTRETFLKITKPYFIDPDKKTAAIIGTGVHSQMWSLLQTEKGEETIKNNLIQGTYDLYDPATKTLYDYKTWGSWKLVQILSGSFEERASALFEVLLQMHQYKILILEKYPDIEIENLAVQVISRDTNLKIAEQRGITQSSPLIIIPSIDEKVVREYFEVKSQKLQKALNEDWAPVCTSRETWETKKCQKYCEVKEICYSMPLHGDISWIELEEQQAKIEERIIQLTIQKLKNEVENTSQLISSSMDNLAF